jgi:hypothetical protein
MIERTLHLRRVGSGSGCARNYREGFGFYAARRRIDVESGILFHVESPALTHYEIVGPIAVEQLHRIIFMHQRSKNDSTILDFF